ncbi:MAG TPA: flagellar basal body protein, partial [Ramlibacter sp.]|nr:flagellar basal body protein [Ramlibacter sp.]
MLDSIHVGMTGLLGYSRGLRVIANNTANLNTPGFKASTLQFTDLAYGGSADGATRLGHGLGT